jgi:hypothetical protein
MTAEPQGAGEAPKQCLRREGRDGVHGAEQTKWEHYVGQARDACRRSHAGSPMIVPQSGLQPPGEAVAFAS